MSADTIELQRILATHSPDLSDVLGRAGTKVVLLAGSKDPNAKVTLVLLDEYGPAFVVKAPTTREAERVVRNEGHALKALAVLPLGPLAATLPCAVGFMSFEGRSALVSTAVTGQPMTVAYHAWRHTARRRHVRADFAAAGLWLGDLQSRTAQLAAPVALVTESLNRIIGRYPKHPSLGLVKRTLEGPQARLTSHSAPRTVVHGDFWCGNIMIGPIGAVTGVVDWESCQMSGEPLRDVARFATSYALYLDRHTRAGKRVHGHPDVRGGVFGTGILRMMRGQSWFSSIAQNYLTLALGRLGMPTDLWRDVIIGGIADVAATADHPEFSEQHLQLLARLTPPASFSAQVPIPRKWALKQPGDDELSSDLDSTGDVVAAAAADNDSNPVSDVLVDIFPNPHSDDDSASDFNEQTASIVSGQLEPDDALALPNRGPGTSDVAA